MSRRASAPPARVPARPAAPASERGPEAAPLFPGPRDLADPLQPFLIPLLLLLVGRWIASLYMPFASEDAYITFRYSKHLADGMGAVYNQGERVMGFTSAPWMLLNAAGCALFKDPILWSRIWTVAGDMVTVLVMGSLLRRSASLAAAWCFNGFFAVWPFYAAVAISGMETSLMVTLIALGGALAARGSPASGPVMALLALWRPEGLASAALIGLGARWRDRAVAAGLAAAGLAAIAIYYGSPLPQSLAAKSQIYGTAGPWFGRHWWEWIVPFLFGRYPIASEGNNMLPFTVLLAPALVAGVPVLWRERRSGLALAIGAALVVWLGYAVLGVAYFFWYMAVPLAGIVALAAVGLPRIVRGRAVYVSCALFVVSVWSLAPKLYLGRAKAEYFTFGVVAQYLLENASNGDKVMLEPIGMIGYHTPVRIVDEVGLVSPEVATRRLQGPGWYADVAARERPDWLVVRGSFLESGVAWAGTGAPFRSSLERDSLLARYKVVFGTEKEAGDLALAVLRRR